MQNANNSEASANAYLGGILARPDLKTGNQQLGDSKMKIQSLSNQIYDYIVNQIRVGNLPLGRKINENDLLDKLPTSRTPIREALIQLTADGILDCVPRKGYFVKTISQETMLEHCQVIAQLDCQAMLQALPNLREQDYRKMREIIKAIDAVILERDYREYCELSDLFHLQYYRCSGNKSLPGIIFDIRNRCLLTTYFNQDKDKLFALLADVNLEHRQILALAEACAAAPPAGSAQAGKWAELEKLIILHWTKADTHL